MDLMTRRRALLARVESGGRLPAEYQRVEYIQTTNGALIRTDVYGLPEFVVEADLMHNFAGDQAFMGAWYKGRLTGVAGYYGGNNQWFCAVYFNIGRAISSQAVYRCEFNPGDHKAYIDGVLVGTSTKALDQVSELIERFYLFGTYTGAARQYGYTGKCYGVKLWDWSNNLLAHYVPCYRKADNEIGMYDLVSNTFYSKFAETGGSFTKGSDIN